MRNNIITQTDTYKLGHARQYPKDAEYLYSYFESRPGAEFDHTIFFGLQYLLKEYLVGQVVTWDKLEHASMLSMGHLGKGKFNYAGWSALLQKHRGVLPLLIKAVPEGTRVPVGNVMMTVMNTDPEFPWLTNYVEGLLTHIWSPSVVATFSAHAKEIFTISLEKTADDLSALPFMLHDFSFRGDSSSETAAASGAGHLINFMGTDTLPAIEMVADYYGGNLSDGSIALSVTATEHSTMTARGKQGEFEVVQDLLDDNPTGIVSCVGDSYDIYNFVKTICSERFKPQILAREGAFVTRPDSVTEEHQRPHELVLWIIQQLWDNFGGHTNSKNFRVLNPHVRIIWGDGISLDGCCDILMALAGYGWSAENIVFGMGKHLVQAWNRDTQRSAFKACAIQRSGHWNDIYKETYGKKSKRGQMKLIQSPSGLVTVGLEHSGEDCLQTAFLNGDLFNEISFDQVRANALA